MRGPKNAVTVAEKKLNTETTKKTKADKSKVKKDKKDPNAPKRPPSAFFVFMDDFRKDFKENFPDNKSVSVVAKEGGAKWKSMSDSEKAPYVAKAATKKAEYGIAVKQHNDDINEAAKEKSTSTSKSSSSTNDDVAIIYEKRGFEKKNNNFVGDNLDQRHVAGFDKKVIRKKTAKDGEKAATKKAEYGIAMKQHHDDLKESSKEKSAASASKSSSETVDGEEVEQEASS